MSVMNFNELFGHVGHDTRVVYYGEQYDVRNVAIECDDCQCVLLDFDKVEPETCIKCEEPVNDCKCR